MTELKITWVRTVREKYERTVDLDDLPSEVGEAWERGDILTTDSYSANAAHEALIEWASTEEGEVEPVVEDVVDRRITLTEQLGHGICMTCDWSTPAYSSPHIIEAALMNHMATMHGKSA